MHMIFIAFHFSLQPHHMCLPKQCLQTPSRSPAWTPAPTASNVSVTYYIDASSSTYQTVRRTVTDPDREVVISGLHPFAEYYITVQGGNPGGLSDLTGRSATTLTAGVYFVTVTVTLWSGLIIEDV